MREREAGEGMRIMLRRGDASRVSFTSEYKDAQSSLSLDMRPTGAGGRVLEDIQSADDHSYPPADPSMVSLDGAAAAVVGNHAHNDSIGVASDKTLTLVKTMLSRAWSRASSASPRRSTAKTEVRND